MDNQGQYGLFIYASNALRCTVAGHIALSANNVVVPGEWQHIACVYDGTALRVYRNGINVAETPGTGPILTNGNSGVSLAQDNPDGDEFIGRLDQVRIWNTARSA
ncbi:MAG: LamG domain-containing protein, partial [Kofleriaceae bacterium]|nr:LamG domain-containing protein [Kofleriaceae bacterium]